MHNNDFTFYLMIYSHTRHYRSGLVYYILVKTFFHCNIGLHPRLCWSSIHEDTVMYCNGIMLHNFAPKTSHKQSTKFYWKHSAAQTDKILSTKYIKYKKMNWVQQILLTRYDIHDLTKHHRCYSKYQWFYYLYGLQINFS